MSMVPRWFNRIPSRKRNENGDLFRDVFNDFFETDFGSHSGLTVSSDDKHIYIEAHVPGLAAKDIDVSIDSENMLWIKGEKKEEEKGKKFYKKAQQSFSYCVPLWDEVDYNVDPEAICKDGIMKITFSKKREKQVESKKISVKEK